MPRGQLFECPTWLSRYQFPFLEESPGSPHSPSPSPQLHRGAGFLQVPEPRHQGGRLGQGGQRVAREPAAARRGREPSVQAVRVAGLSAPAGWNGRQPACTVTTLWASMSMLGGRQPGDTLSAAQSSPGPACPVVRGWLLGAHSLGGAAPPSSAVQQRRDTQPGWMLGWLGEQGRDLTPRQGTKPGLRDRLYCCSLWVTAQRELCGKKRS